MNTCELRHFSSILGENFNESLELIANFDTDEESKAHDARLADALDSDNWTYVIDDLQT